MDIRLEDLSIGYKGQPSVARNINVEFRGGQLSCLVGRNGSGKSTLLKTVSGFLPVRGGAVFLGDKSVSSMSKHDLSRTVGIVLTGSPDVQNLTVAETVALGRSPYTGFFGTLRSSDKAIVDAAIAEVGIQPLAGKMIQSLSDGERQKVMIARALAQQTPSILLDEPTAFLDYPSKSSLMSLLHRLAHVDGKTILLSTHDLDIALRFADSFFLMSEGQLREVSKEEVKAMTDQK